MLSEVMNKGVLFYIPYLKGKRNIRLKETLEKLNTNVNSSYGY